jgi:hypothetical protein
VCHKVLFGDVKSQFLNRFFLYFSFANPGDEYFANLIDYEARKVKERRAYEEAKTGRYHHPGFIKREYLVLRHI